MKQQLRERMAALDIDIDETVAERHLANVAAELKNPAAPARRPPGRRVRVGALVAATLLVLLPGAALAAEGAAPGDLLYPVKLAVEQVVGLVDPNIEAEHRIEELEILVDRAVPFEKVVDGLEDADRAVQQRDVPDDLLERFERVRDRVVTDYGPHRDDAPEGERRGELGESDRPPTTVDSDEPPPATTTTTAPPETDRPAQSTTTTEPPRDDRGGSDHLTTTTEPPRRGDDPPRDG